MAHNHHPYTVFPTRTHAHTVRAVAAEDPLAASSSSSAAATAAAATAPLLPPAVSQQAQALEAAVSFWKRIDLAGERRAGLEQQVGRWVVPRSLTRLLQQTRIRTKDDDNMIYFARVLWGEEVRSLWQ